ncbi:MAG: EAL domain-containing protein [Rhodobacterales bacterium]|nr:EAL domain-containing protein [Rhodobacterales bacterium]
MSETRATRAVEPEGVPSTGVFPVAWGRRLFDTSVHFLAACRGPILVFVNPAGARLLGHDDPAALAGRSFAGLVHGDDRAALGSGDRPYPADGTVHSVRLLGRDGRVVPVDLRVRAHDADSGLTLVEARDARRRRADEQRLRLAATVIENLDEAVIVTDADFHVTDVNPAFTTITGREAAEVLGRQPPFYVPLVANAAQHAAMRDALAGAGRWEGEVWNKRKDGEPYAERLSVTAITGIDGTVRQYVCVVSDVTKRKHDEERIRYQANYDGLTGLPNRTQFLARLGRDLARMRRLDRGLALMFLDLDGFKLVNDTLGHDVGDMLLKETGVRLLGSVREGDTVARLGGDEFTVIMPGIADTRHASIVAQRILDAVARPYLLAGHEAFVSGSIGITVFPEDGDDPTILLKNADAAMYEAKEAGKAVYKYYTTRMNEEVAERLVMKNGLIKALDRDQFVLHYQPKMDLPTGTVTGVEALMRWRHPSLGLVPPGKFISILEETGLVVPVGAWALRTACRQHATWKAAGLAPIPVAVNLSARQLREPDFTDVVAGILAETGVDATGLQVEITESMLMTDSATAVETLGRLHDMGIAIAMDDFGTGYSSLSYLKRFPIDTIKIDRSFVADITSDPDDAEIIKTIISMGKTLNRRIVAEGVETEGQLDLLRQYKCDEMQGYFLSRPLPAEDATGFLMGLKGGVALAPPGGAKGEGAKGEEA